MTRWKGGVNVIPIRGRCPTFEAMAEMWRPVPSRPRYEVAWDGRVRNALSGRVLKPQQAKSGHYRKVHLGRDLQAQVHQVVAEAWLPRPQVGMPLVVDHVDNDGTRNCAANLRWLTYSMNTRQWYAMNARYEAAGVENGWTLEPVVPGHEWEDTYDRLAASGL